MRAQIINENLDFERGGDPKSSMGIGLNPISTSVSTNDMEIVPADKKAYIYFDEEGWDDTNMAIEQIKAFAEGTHDLIDYDEIEEELNIHGFAVDPEEDFELVDDFEVAIPIIRL